MQGRPTFFDQFFSIGAKITTTGVLLRKAEKPLTIGSMRSFCCEAISEKIIAFEKLRKENLMKQAANDPGYIERCEEVCKDFAATDYPGGTDEW